VADPQVNCSLKWLSSNNYSKNDYLRFMQSKEDIKVLFSSLLKTDKESLLGDLLQELELEESLLEKVGPLLGRKKKPCPHCHSESVYKRGKQNGVQMYNCKDCKKWFSETTGTPLSGIQLKDKWQSYLHCMEQGMAIKKIAKDLNISIQTSFDWRHKILSSMNDLAPSQLSGTVECDELELSINEKGNRNLKRKARKRSSDFQRNQGKGIDTVVQIITAVERGGNKYLKAVQAKRLSTENIQQVFEDKLAKGTILITDKHPSYKSFPSQENQIKHKTIKADRHVDPKDSTIHLQHVNNTHNQLRNFLRPFNGVSSKYLQNYLNWFAYQNQIKEKKATLMQWLITILLSDQAYDLFCLFKQNAVLIRT
jgi:transposase-like protein